MRAVGVCVEDAKNRDKWRFRIKVLGNIADVLTIHSYYTYRTLTILIGVSYIVNYNLIYSLYYYVLTPHYYEYCFLIINLFDS